MIWGCHTENSACVVDGAVAAVHGIEPVGNEQGTIRRHGHVRGAVVPIYRAADNVDNASGITCADLFRGKRPHDVAAGLGVNHLSPKGLRQQVALIHEDAGGRA